MDAIVISSGHTVRYGSVLQQDRGLYHLAMGTLNPGDVYELQGHSHIFKISVDCEKYWPYEYCIHIDAQCPEDRNAVRFLMYDESNDSYSLEMRSSARKDHTVRYNSKKPGIRYIQFQYQ